MSVVSARVRRMPIALVIFACALGMASGARANLFGSTYTYQALYAPASALIAHGSVQVGSFVYLPAKGGDLDPNQLHNTSLGDVYLDRNVDAFFPESLSKELRFVGIDVSGGPVLSGEIGDFTDDDLNSDTTTLSVHYVVTDAKGAVLYDATKTTTRRMGIGNVSPVDYPLTANFEALIADPAFIAAINPAENRP